jgi:acetolactate synthase-1/2/3 large subunit
MNGAEALVASAISGGVEICFANPGTTELPLVQALDSVPGLQHPLPA